MITAQLKGAQKFETLFGTCIVGRVFGDVKGRWPDGRLIRTSPVLGIVWVPPGIALAQTENSVYLLED